jgi:acyl-CoA synthetase (AMP-forming)/AMP-acid ligase II
MLAQVLEPRGHQEVLLVAAGLGGVFEDPPGVGPIAAALCAGVPDRRLGEAIHAVVVPKPGARLSADALRDWIAGQVERHMVPDVIAVRDALPVGATGKADRRAIGRS